MDDDGIPSTGQVLKWTIRIGLTILAVALLVGSMQIFGWGWFQRSTANFRGETAALEQIQANPNSRISAYDHFFSLCASVQGHETTIKALQSELETDPSPRRVEQINAFITANRAARDVKIQQYNQDAQRNYTVGQFRDAGLPEKLDINEEVTTCAE